ncbi:uncharacterized protein [Argopecten irradians]|uniref:uncharacterized protein n=1 Tax=Argopecten irradians TaxID=31199 RepID=UPI0037243C7B
MSNVSVIECGPIATPREGSYPQLRNKNRIAKGCHLSSVTRLSVNSSSYTFDPKVCSVRGSSLLCVEPTREYQAPQNSPRTNTTSPRNPQKVLEPPESPDIPSGDLDDRPLSVVGERFNSLSGTTSRAISRVSSYVPPSRTETTASFYNKPSKDISDVLLAYEDSGEGEPNGPPPTPSECSISSFKVDGLRIGSMCETRHTQSNRDFNPGYVKRTTYCCDKCAERMTCHESLVLDTRSPFYYQKFTSTDDVERCTSHYTPVSDDIHTFLESSLSCSLDNEQKRQFSRLWGNESRIDHLHKSSAPSPKEENSEIICSDLSSSCKACVIERRGEDSSDSESLVNDGTEQEVTLSDLNDKEVLIESHVETNHTSQQLTPDQTHVHHVEKEGTDSPDTSRQTVDSSNVRSAEKEEGETDKTRIFWSSDWRPQSPVKHPQDKGGMASPSASRSHNKESGREPDMITLPSICVKTRPKSGTFPETDREDPKLPLKEIDRNSNTCDGPTPKLQNSYSPPVFDRGLRRTAIEQRAKDTLQQEVFHGGSYTSRKDEQNADLCNALLQATQVIISRKPNIPQCATANNEETITKTTPKLPSFKAKKPSYARKALPFQEDQNRCFKPIDKSLVFHAASDTGAVVKLSNSNPSGDSTGQSTSGLVRIRMDKASKERLLLSRMARHKVVPENLLPRKRPVSEVKLPSATTPASSTISHLSLNHLLQTIPNHSTSKNKLVEGNNTPKKQDTQNKEPSVLAPEVVGLQKKQQINGTTETTKKDQKRSSKRKCTIPKKPLLDMMNKAFFREIELKMKNRDSNRVRNVSSLSFTPSFSYSLFELPEIYRKYNKDIENRVSMAWPVSRKLKQH